MALYMIGSLLVTGIFMFKAIQNFFPDTDPIIVVNNYLIYWILFELLFRYFMQKLPVLNIKPLLALPISRSNIANFVLFKSTLSFFNVLPLFWIIPFSINLIIEGYPVLNVLAWVLALIGLILSVNFLNFLINKKNAVFYTVLLVLVGAIALEYFDVFKFSHIFGELFNYLYDRPILAAIPLLLAGILYRINYKYLKNNLFLDASLKTKTQEISTQDLSWTRRFGEIAPFLQLDLKLIWRNKRPKMTVYLSLALILYGLYFYTNAKMLEMPIILLFAGIFMTGMFLSNFGQFIPAWDSSYYSMMMAQNIPMRKYLESKAGLITFSVVILFLLTIPYVYFGWNVLAINAAAALYNIGVNIPLLLWITSFNKKRVDLEKSPMMNYQGMGAAQWIFVLPFLGLPALIFGLTALISSSVIGVALLALLGILGILFRNTLFNKITELYKRKKYAMVAGFNEKQ